MESTINNELQRANRVLHGYLEEKERIGLVSNLKLFWSVTAEQANPSEHAHGQHRFEATEEYYLKVLCSELARICCGEGITPQVREYPSIVDRQLVWNIHGCLYYRSDETHVPTMVEFLRTRRGVLWTPEYVTQLVQPTQTALECIVRKTVKLGPLP